MVAWQRIECFGQGIGRSTGGLLHKLPTDLLIQQFVDYRVFMDVSKKNPEAGPASGVVFLKNGLSENGAERLVMCCTAERCNK